MEFRLVDLEPTLDKGQFKCHVCGKKFPSPLPGHQYSAPPVRKSGSRTLVYVFLAVLIALVSVYYFNVTSKSKPVSVQHPGQAPASLAGKTASPAAQAGSEKLQLIKRIAEDYHKSHTYTLEAEFVCVDMAIGVWNELVTNGIDAKIMGGNVQEDISSWDYRQLITKSNHAWVVAQISPTEKAAVETTAGKVFTSDMKLAFAYFRGIVFDNPAQVKKFEFLRKKAGEVCPEANQMINDWNNNVVGKQQRTEANIALQSRIEQRKQDCDSTIKKMDEFRSRAIFNNPEENGTRIR